jgi:ribosomal protein S8E
VVIENQKAYSQRDTKKLKSVNHLKIIVIPDLKAQTINRFVQMMIIEKDAVIDTDATKSYTGFANYLPNRLPRLSNLKK